MYNVLEKLRAAKGPLPRFADPPQRGGTRSATTLDDRKGSSRNESLPSGEGARRAGEVPSLTSDEKRIFDNALILILKELHDELDAAVASAYGWPVDLPADDKDQVAAVILALGSRNSFASPADVAKDFKQGKKCEARVATTCESLTRMGFIAASANGKNFAIRRAV